MIAERLASYPAGAECQPQPLEKARCVSTQTAAGTTVGRISEPNWYANTITSRWTGEKPVCDATSGPAVIATFFRKSATTPHATTGSSAT